MTEQEVREVIKSNGWSFLQRERRSRSYVYAARKVRGERIEVYVSAFTKLAQLTLDQLRKKLGIVVPTEENQFVGKMLSPGHIPTSIRQELATSVTP